ncbi:MAG: orotidine 5'-phosphate decarboxylase / HUMPS family protein [Patescibacteria group bacterium]
MRAVYIAISLDGMDSRSARTLFDQVEDMVDFVKMSDLVDRYGAAPIREYNQSKPVFVDTKLHDTPTTVMNRAHVYIEAGAAFFSVHAEEKVLRAASLIAVNSDTKVIAVTELTSEPDDPEIADKVLRKAQLAAQHGIIHMTCSGFEAPVFRRSFNYKDTHLFIPGMVPEWASKPVGQERTVDPRDALKLADGRDCTLILGRVVTQAETYGMKPFEVVHRIRREISSTK